MKKIFLIINLALLSIININIKGFGFQATCIVRYSDGDLLQSKYITGHGPTAHKAHQRARRDCIEIKNAYQKQYPNKKLKAYLGDDGGISSI